MRHFDDRGPNLWTFSRGRGAEGTDWQLRWLSDKPFREVAAFVSLLDLLGFPRMSIRLDLM